MLRYVEDARIRSFRELRGYWREGIRVNKGFRRPGAKALIMYRLGVWQLGLQPGLVRGRFRPRGSYLSTVTIPGNLLAKGMVLVNASLRRVNPNNLEFSELSAVAFNVIDSIEGNSARGDWSKDMIGVVRPLLDWSTECSPQEYSGFPPQNAKNICHGFCNLKPG